MTRLQIIQVNKLLHDRLAYVRSTTARPVGQQTRVAQDISAQIYRAIVTSGGTTLDGLAFKFDLANRSLSRHVTALVKAELILKRREGYQTIYTGRGN